MAFCVTAPIEIDVEETTGKLICNLITNLHGGMLSMLSRHFFLECFFLTRNCRPVCTCVRSSCKCWNQTILLFISAGNVDWLSSGMMSDYVLNMFIHQFWSKVMGKIYTAEPQSTEVMTGRTTPVNGKHG